MNDCTGRAEVLAEQVRAYLNVEPAMCTDLREPEY